MGWWRECMSGHSENRPEPGYGSLSPGPRTSWGPPPQAGHFTSCASGWNHMRGSGIASLLRRGLRVARRAALLAEVSDVVGWDVEDTRACAAGSAAEPHAPRLITGCWLRLAHQSPSSPNFPPHPVQTPNTPLLH